MSLDTLYGINGVGKDTVAERLRQSTDRNLIVTSMSRLSMYLLGITKSFDVSKPVSGEAYKQLEQVPQPEMVALENGPYKDMIGELAQGGDRALLLGHLITALHLGGSVKYLTERPTPDWYIENNSSMIQLTAPANTILQRRQHDASGGVRSRPVEIGQIVEHQELCDEEWSRIENGSAKPLNGLHIVENQNLETAVAKVKEIIYE